MIQQLLDLFSNLSPFWIYAALFFFAFVENVFPPSPSDLVVVVGGSLIAANSIHFIPTLILTTLGSLIGFMTIYILGSQLDQKVVRAGKIKYISTERLDKAERWFIKYGYFIILINRFMPGARFVISLFAGLSEMNAKKTAVLAAISALLWNSFVIYLGIIFGRHIEVVDSWLSTYSNVFLIVTAIVVIFFFARIFRTKRRNIKL
jgi:membrane protein DedA with SNARE-associated domain